jgi:hypothetical protein
MTLSFDHILACTLKNKRTFCNNLMKFSLFPLLLLAVQSNPAKRKADKITPAFTTQMVLALSVGKEMLNNGPAGIMSRYESSNYAEYGYNRDVTEKEARESYIALVCIYIFNLLIESVRY